MPADERQAAAAYAYAWWMTGDEDAASTALGAALATAEPAQADDAARRTALMSGVREALGDLRTMPPSSELALLHDGFDVPLEAAGRLAGVDPQATALALATGRLEALLETVRGDFRHTEHLGGLAVGDPEALAHAADCHSCRKALTLIERGRVELREVSPVSAPPGMIARMIAAAAPPAATDAQTTDASAADAAEPVRETPTPSLEELEEMLRHEAPTEGRSEAPAAVVAPPPASAPPKAPVAPAPPEAPEAPPEVEPDRHEPAPQEAPPAAPPGRVPTTPARRRAATVLAGAGIVTMIILGSAMLASREPDPAADVAVSEEPVVTGSDAPEPTQPTTRPDPERTADSFGPPVEDRKGFAVVAAGLLLSDSDELAPSGTTIGPQDQLRVAVDYTGASKGVELNAVWRVGDRVFERLQTVVSSRASRHVWGLPVPAEGWPPGRHRIVVTTEEGLAASIDFTIRESD